MKLLLRVVREPRDERRHIKRSVSSSRKNTGNPGNPILIYYACSIYAVTLLNMVKVTVVT